MNGNLPDVEMNGVRDEDKTHNVIVPENDDVWVMTLFMTAFFMSASVIPQGYSLEKVLEQRICTY